MTTRHVHAHPDFTAAPPHRRYAGSLRGLWVFLDYESKQRVGADCWRILPGGAVVSMRRRSDGKRVLRIARSKKPEGAAAEQAWAREVDTFVAHWPDVAAWRRVDDADATGVAVEFHEAPPLTCPSCGEPLTVDIAVLGEVCPSCALARKRGA